MGFRSARLAAKKTVQEVLQFMGVSSQAVYQWETGETMPRPDKLAKLAEFYNCSIEELLKSD